MTTMQTAEAREVEPPWPHHYAIYTNYATKAHHWARELEPLWPRHCVNYPNYNTNAYH